MEWIKCKKIFSLLVWCVSSWQASADEAVPSEMLAQKKKKTSGQMLQDNKNNAEEMT